MSEISAEPVDLPGPWEQHLSAPVVGRKVIMAFEMLAGMTRTVEALHRWGAQPPLLLAEGVGTGPVPPPEAATVVMLEDPRYTSMTEQVRGRLHPEARLSAEAREAIQRYDPDGSALWWFSPVGPNTPVLGRAALGGRPPHQIALEDKGIVDEILDSVPADRAPAVVVPATYDDLVRGTQQVLGEAGGDHVVWAADASHGINGGGDLVRWIRTEQEMKSLAPWFAQRCDRVRVSAFLEGVPCSIHGLVLPDGVAVLRPLELVSLRDPVHGRFCYAGMGTTWDPPPAERDAMRRLARGVGQQLAKRYDYRGAFGLDGVMTARGFRVTELNARLSGGLTRLGRATPTAHLELVQINALLGRDIRMAAAAYEELMLELAEETRFIDALGISTTLTSTETVEVPVTLGEERLDVAAPSDDVVGTVIRGPSPMGSYIRMTVVPGVIGIGDRAAPLSVLLYEFADRYWDAGFGQVLMPPDVLRRP
jgi:hypothetical protein